MSFFKKLFGLDVTSHVERAEKYERIGKLGMAKFELEQALDQVGWESNAQREQINAFLDRIELKEQEDAEARAQEALTNVDNKKARYYLNVALSKLDEESPAYDRLLAQLNRIPEEVEEAEIEDELETILRVETGVDFVDRQRALEFWKSGFPPYKEDYYFKKALTSDVIRSQAEQALTNPADPDACFNFGVTLAQLGLINKALDQIRRFALLKPEDRDGHYSLANLLADQGCDDEAIREFEKTISIDPHFMEAYFYLGQHYLNLGDHERAEKIFEHVVQQEKDSELAEDCRAKLEMIRSLKLR